MPMANVDPFIVAWPQKWVTDPEISPVVTYLNRFLHDLWLRTGGGDDILDATASELALLEKQVSVAEYHQLADDVDRLLNYNANQEYEELRGEIDSLTRGVGRNEWEATAITSDYTAVDHDFVESTGNITIKFDANASHNDQIITCNGDGKRLIIDGNGVQLRYKDRRENCLTFRNEGSSTHWYMFASGASKYWRAS